MAQVAAAQIIELNNPEQVVAITADARDLAWVDSNSGEGMSFPASGKDVILVKNDELAVQTVSIDAAPDSAGRDGAITDYSIGPDEIAWFGVFDTNVWRQSDGMIDVSMSDDGVQIIVMRLP